MNDTDEERLDEATPIAHFDEDAIALMAIARAVGVSSDSSGYDIVRAVRAALVPLCPGCHQPLGDLGPHWRAVGGPWWHYRCTDEVARLARGESVVPSGEVRETAGSSRPAPVDTPEVRDDHA